MSDLLKKLLGLNALTMAAINAFASNVEIANSAVSYAELPEKTKTMLEKIGFIPSERVYDPNVEYSPEAQNVWKIFQQAVFDETHNLLGEFLAERSAKFTEAGYPSKFVHHRFVIEGAKSVVVRGVQIMINDIGFIMVNYD